MTVAIGFAVIMAAIWGVLWALFLQYHPHGKFLVARMTWLTVVIGVGMDLTIAIFIIPIEPWLIVFGIIGASAIPIIIRSLVNESKDSQNLLTLENERTRSTDTTPDSQ